MIRAARIDDVAALPGVERAAGARFRQVGMAAIADDEPLAMSELLGYARLGFSVVPHAALSAELRTIRARETAHSLDAWPRVAMRRPVDATTPPAS